METVTTAQAADLLDVTPEHLRKMVQRGSIQPLRRGARPLQFRDTDVIALARRRADAHAQTPAAKAHARDIWDEVDRMLAR